MGRLARPIRRPDWNRLDRRRPFNLDYPGWAGCQLALMPFPHLRGGATWVDPWHQLDGTLTGMYPAADWLGESLAFNGLTGYVDCGKPGTLSNLSGLTIVLDATCLVATTHDAWWDVLSMETNDYTARGWGIRRRPTNIGDDIVFTVNIGGSKQEILSGVAWETGARKHIVATYDGAAMRVAVNGVEAATRSVSGWIWNSENNLNIGRRVSSADRYFNGEIRYLLIFDRGCTASECDAHYEQAQRGWPDTLRWIRGRSMASVPANPVFGSRLLNLRRRAAAA